LTAVRRDITIFGVTTSLFDPEKFRKELAARGIDLGFSSSPSRRRKRKTAPLSGRDLSRRLAGLLTPKEANELEKHVNESCEVE
jgi:hypothetical protein